MKFLLVVIQSAIAMIPLFDLNMARNERLAIVDWQLSNLMKIDSENK